MPAAQQKSENFGWHFHRPRQIVPYGLEPMQAPRRSNCIPLYPEFRAKVLFSGRRNGSGPCRLGQFPDFTLYPAIVSSFVFSAGFWVFFGSLDKADDLA
jgi:hypothetical protein